MKRSGEFIDRIGMWVLLAAGASFGCGPRPAGSSTPGDPGVVADREPADDSGAATGGGTGVPAGVRDPASLGAGDGGGCRVRAERMRADGLRVHPEGGEPIVLGVADAAVEVEAGADPEAVVIRVSGALRFEGVSGAVGLRPDGTPVSASPGMMLSGDSRLDRITAAGPDAVWADVGPGNGVTVSRVRVACRGLTVAAPTHAPIAWPDTEPGSPVWLPAAFPLRLSDGPSAPPSLEVSAEEPVLLPFVERDRQGESVLLSLGWHGGARLSGWARAGDLVRGRASGFGGPSGSGEPTCPGAWGCGGRGIYCGPAEVAEGAVVYAEAGEGRWGEVAVAGEMQVRIEEGNAWVRLQAVPGLWEGDPCVPIRHAWVARDRVRRPDEVPPVRVRVEVDDLDLACARGHSECAGSLSPAVVNDGDEPVVVQRIAIRYADSEIVTELTPPSGEERLAPGARWERAFEVRLPGEHEVRAAVVTADGFRVETSVRTARVRNPALEAARAECDACAGVWGTWGIAQSEGCICRTSDAGRACRDGEECEGLCLFERFEEVSPGMGVPVGRCSEMRVMFGCHPVIRAGASSDPPVSRPWRAPTICID